MPLPTSDTSGATFLADFQRFFALILHRRPQLLEAAHQQRAEQLLC